MVLVTGCNSNLGMNLVNRLIQDGNTVRCIDRFKPKNMPQNFEFFTSDLTNHAILKKACQGVDTIYHLMSIVSPSHIGRSNMKRINIKGTRNLILQAKIAKVKKFIFLSTFEVYGEPDKIPTIATYKTKPITKFGKDKLKAEKHLRQAMKETMLDITIFRPALILGPGTQNPKALITLYMALGAGKQNRIYTANNDEDTFFQMLHHDDAVSAFIKSAQTDKSKGKIYNIGSDSVPTMQEQLHKVIEKAQVQSEIKALTPSRLRSLSWLMRMFKFNFLSKDYLVYLLGDVLLDCNPAKEELNWQPKKNNIDIILDTVEWYRNNRLKKKG